MAEQTQNLLGHAKDAWAALRQRELEVTKREQNVLLSEHKCQEREELLAKREQQLWERAVALPSVAAADSAPQPTGPPSAGADAPLLSFCSLCVTNIPFGTQLEALMEYFSNAQMGKLQAGRVAGASMQGWLRLATSEEAQAAVGVRIRLPNQRDGQYCRVEYAKREFCLSQRQLEDQQADLPQRNNVHSAP